MNNDKPRVSIGLPVYNGAKFLKDSLDSFLCQTFTDFELIISDNASTDRTQEICRAYAANDSRIRYYHNKTNLGASWNFNRVFKLSRGEYFKWAAADDLCAQDFLHKCVEVLDQEPDIILCYAKSIIIDEKGNFVRSCEDGLNLQSKSASGRFLQLMYNLNLCHPVFGLIRSDILKGSRLFQGFIGDDEVLLAELSLKGKFKEIPHHMFFRRFHPDSFTIKLIVNNSDPDKKIEWFNPARKHTVVLPYWRIFFEHLLSVYRAQIVFSQKILPYLYLIGGVFMNYRNYANELIKKRKSNSHY